MSQVVHTSEVRCATYCGSPYCNAPMQSFVVQAAESQPQLEDETPSLAEFGGVPAFHVRTRESGYAIVISDSSAYFCPDGSTHTRVVRADVLVMEPEFAPVRLRDDAVAEQRDAARSARRSQLRVKLAEVRRERLLAEAGAADEAMPPAYGDEPTLRFYWESLGYSPDPDAPAVDTDDEFEARAYSQYKTLAQRYRSGELSERGFWASVESVEWNTGLSMHDVAWLHEATPFQVAQDRFTLSYVLRDRMDDEADARRRSVEARRATGTEYPVGWQGEFEWLSEVIAQLREDYRMAYGQALVAWMNKPTQRWHIAHSENVAATHEWLMAEGRSHVREYAQLQAITRRVESLKARYNVRRYIEALGGDPDAYRRTDSWIAEEAAWSEAVAKLNADYYRDGVAAEGLLAR